MEPLVDIIICVKNNKEIISKCLESVKKQRYKNINCMVLDDNSTDGTCDLIKKKYKFVTCITLSGKGPSFNRNEGIKKSGGKYIITMDSDAILNRDWVKKMVLFMEKNIGIGIASGKILYENSNKINIAGGGMGKSGIVCHLGEGKNKNEETKIKKVIYLCSASMIIRRKILKKIGLFDPEYFYGYEDLDLCWRANLAGFEVIYYPFAESYHEQNTTIKNIPSPRISFLGNRNRILTLLKNYEGLSLLRYFPTFIAHFIFLILFRKNKISILKAYLWNIKKFDKILKKRKRINKIRKIKDKELIKIF